MMGAMTFQIISVSSVYSSVCSSVDQRKHQSSAPLAFVRRIHQWPVNSPHKGPVTRKMFPFDDVIMKWQCCSCLKNSNGRTLKGLEYRNLTSWRMLSHRRALPADATCFSWNCSHYAIQSTFKGSSLDGLCWPDKCLAISASPGHRQSWHFRHSFKAAPKSSRVPLLQPQWSQQSGRSPKVVALFSATNFSSYIIELLQPHDTIQIKWNYAWIH